MARAGDRLVGHRAAGDQGTPAYIIATGIDITERKRLEQAFSRSVSASSGGSARICTTDWASI